MHIRSSIAESLRQLQESSGQQMVVERVKLALVDRLPVSGSPYNVAVDELGLVERLEIEFAPQKEASDPS